MIAAFLTLALLQSFFFFNYFFLIASIGLQFYTLLLSYVSSKVNFGHDH